MIVKSQIASNMKKEIALLSLLIGFMGFTFAQNGWVNTPFQSTQSGSNNIVEVYFMNADSGMVITENNTQSRLWFTTDGGNTWVMDTVLNSLNSFTSPTAMNAWVCGDGGAIYKGTLGLSGLSWTAQTSGAFTNLNDIYMVNNTKGYAVGDLGVVRSTTNGGTLWSNPMASNLTFNINAVCFPTTNSGFVAGGSGFQGTIVKTINSGVNWGTPTTVIGIINDIDFPSESVGYAVGNGGSVNKTTNGTLTTPNWVIKPTGVTSTLRSVQFLNVDTGFVVGDNGLILKTMDGGTTWQNQSLPTARKANRVWMVDYNTVYVGIDSNDVYKTTTSGLGLDITTTDDSLNCKGYVNLNTQVSYNGSGTLSYTWATSPSLSSTSIANPTAGPLSNDETFYVTVTDGTLTDMDSVFIKVVALPSDTLCMVTVDDSLGHNIVLFEQHVLGAIDHYNIYRESSVAGVWDSIGIIHADSAGYFEDTASNPMVKQYSYKISTVDSCGLESNLSAHHTTMHLQVSQGAGSTWNLLWTPYEGMNFPTYRIWRSDTSKNFVLIDSVPSTSTSYTDLTPPAAGLYYLVEVVSAHICQPWLWSKANTNFNTSRSNSADNGMIVIPPSLTADFTATPTIGTAPLLVQFDDLSQGATEWYWDFGDGDTSTVQNPTHTYTQIGVYDVTLKVSDGQNWDSITKSSIIDIVSSIDDNRISSEIHIYPNPIRKGNSFFIEFSNLEIEDIKLTNILGQEIELSYVIENNKATIHIDHSESGLYLLQIKDKRENRHLRKIIVK